MKIVFFASTEHGRFAGWTGWRPDGVYVGFQDEREVVIDVVECKTWNDAKRHGNYLGDFGPDDGVDADGDFDLDHPNDGETLKEQS